MSLILKNIVRHKFEIVTFLLNKNQLGDTHTLFAHTLRKIEKAEHRNIKSYDRGIILPNNTDFDNTEYFMNFCAIVTNDTVTLPIQLLLLI